MIYSYRHYCNRMCPDSLEHVMHKHVIASSPVHANCDAVWYLLLLPDMEHNVKCIQVMGFDFAGAESRVTSIAHSITNS